MKEHIIVTMTSWTKRITNIPIVMGTLLNQTIMPNKIVLNLSIDEFKNKEKDLPLQVTNFLEENKELIYINWLTGKNIRSWKKTLPTFNLFPNDVIINTDDDILYPNNFIENLYVKHQKFPNNPITIPGWDYKGFHWHCGGGSLDMKKFYENDIEKWLETDITEYADEDSFMTFMAIRHGNPLILADPVKIETYNSVEPLANKDGFKAYRYASKILNDCIENYIPKKSYNFVKL